jgi:UDP-N-acetyl-D-mannosaminuronate dehydrogenase
MTKPSHERVGIIGYGEVGKAVAQFYAHPLIQTTKRDDGLTGVDILHICIPYNSDFVRMVLNRIKVLKPKLTIIHSTVAVGTTQKIGGMVVHSPVRGVHPHLFKSMHIFVKYIGADNKRAAIMAQKHFHTLGIKTKTFFPSKTTELGKLLDTTYYGLCIAFHGEMNRICRKYKVDFNHVATEFNTSYNEGYRKLDMPHVVRPVLTPPNPIIGGHCIIPNVKILKKTFKSKAFDLVLAYSSKTK